MLSGYFPVVVYIHYVIVWPAHAVGIQEARQDRCPFRFSNEADLLLETVFVQRENQEEERRIVNVLSPRIHFLRAVIECKCDSTIPPSRNSPMKSSAGKPIYIVEFLPSNVNLTSFERNRYRPLTVSEQSDD